MENRLGLSTKTFLFSLIASGSLGQLGCFSSFVLRDFPGSVLSAFATVAVGVLSLGAMNLYKAFYKSISWSAQTEVRISQYAQITVLGQLEDAPQSPPTSSESGRVR